MNEAASPDYPRQHRENGYGGHHRCRIARVMQPKPCHGYGNQLLVEETRESVTSVWTEHMPIWRRRELINFLMEVTLNRINERDPNDRTKTLGPRVAVPAGPITAWWLV